MEWIHKFYRSMVAISMLGWGAISSGFADDFSDAQKDPYENYNRHMYTINDTIDRAIFKPLATLYQTLTPNVLQENVTHFFENVDQITTIANDFFQGNTYAGGRDTWRFVINSTLGVGGLFDVATKLGLENHPQDFGLTLMKYGYVSSNYLILPLIGPATVRDALSISVDYGTGIYPYITDTTGYIVESLDIIHTRANLLRYDELQDVVFDPYIAVRNVYWQNRQAQSRESQTQQ